MKNFARALRHSWVYRRRLIVSVICALFAAILWGLNLTSIYPVLKLLHSGSSPHQLIDERITGLQKEVDLLQDKSEVLSTKEKELDKHPSSKIVDQMRRDLTSDQAKLESKLEYARRSLYWSQVARKYIYALMPADPFKTMAWVVLVVFVTVIIKCFFEFGQESMVGSVVNLSLYDLRNRFYRNVIHLDVDQLSTEQGTSELMARFTNDMESLGAGLKTLFGKVVAEPLKALACIIIACMISWQLTLLFLIMVPMTGLVLARIGRIMKQATRRLLERMSSIYKILQESFQGIRVVKAFTMEPYERRRFNAATRDYCRKSQRVVTIDALASPLIEILGVATVACALLSGSYLVLNRHTHIWGLRMVQQPMEPETLLQLYVLLAAVADPVRKLSSVFTRIQSACAAADRVFSFVDRQPKVKSNSDGPRLQRRVRGDHTAVPAEVKAPASRPAVARPYIELRNVCFSYDPNKPVLDHVSLAVQPGETIALVGPNGCGKTTLVGLLPRFFDPSLGTVLIDGQDVRGLHLRSLRQQIGLVTQDAILFADTVYNNIAYGARGATPEAVEAVARKAYADDFIRKLPKGYQTLLTEGGKNVSGGERQRVALARALLRDPSILILDEFTSQMDAEHDALIHRAVHDFIKGRTTFIITHRLHTLEVADRIIVLDAGRLAAVGTHAELLAGCPLYARLQEAYSQRLCA